tara:strand:+ start:1529 stop:1681 length:153 start_codon:yes stop_codon:yes gene_type:complete
LDGKNRISQKPKPGMLNLPLGSKKGSEQMVGNWSKILVRTFFYLTKGKST